MDEREEADRLIREAYRHQMAGRLDEAARLYRESIARCPTAEAHTFLGWTYSFQNRYGDAIAECRRAIEVDPTFGNPYNDIGAYLIELGRPEEAIAWLQQAKQAERYEPRHFPCVNLARAYLLLDRYDAAVPELEEALQREPGYEPARKLMGAVQSRLN